MGLDRHLLTEQDVNEATLRNKITEVRLPDVFRMVRFNTAFLVEAQGDVVKA